MSKTHVATHINGDSYEFLCNTQQTLLDVLRHELDLKGSKEGCATGDCGACSVMMDDRLVCACLVLGVEAEGKKIETIEGLSTGSSLDPLQQKFIDLAALQCGICTPGVLVAAKALLEKNKNPSEKEVRFWLGFLFFSKSAKALLEKNKNPSEKEVRFWLAGNLCRCTGYDKIVRAVLEVAAEARNT